MAHNHTNTIENEKEETTVEVAPHVYSKPFYELELWSRPSKDSELKCEGKIYSETFKRALELIDELYEHYYETDVDLEVVYVRQKAYCVLRYENEWLKEWKYVHGILKEYNVNKYYESSLKNS